MLPYIFFAVHSRLISSSISCMHISPHSLTSTLLCFLMPFKHSQNQIQTFQKWDLDIKTHRERMEKEELDKQFKDADSKLRVVFVCVMWLTRFDVKTLSCLHIEKPIHLPSIHIIHQRPRQSRRR